MGDILYCSCQEEKCVEKNLTISEGYIWHDFLDGRHLCLNPGFFRRDTHWERILHLIVTYPVYRTVAATQHPLSRLQNFGEKPHIFPPEILQVSTLLTGVTRRTY